MTERTVRGNRELRRALLRHMIPFAIRMRYQIGQHNLMLSEIKEHYIFAYTIASQAAGILREYFKAEISDDEIGELAEIFGTAGSGETEVFDFDCVRVGGEQFPAVKI